MESLRPLSHSSPRWYLVFTKPSSEQIATANLERQGYRVYFPRLQQRALKRGAWRQTISALFPRYLFVQLNAAIQSFAPLRSTLGVANVVRFGTEYLAVPEAIISGLIDREDESGLHQLSLSSILQFGSAVRVVQGALAGIEGIFEKHEAQDRVVVLLRLLGRETRVSLPTASLVPI